MTDSINTPRRNRTIAIVVATLLVIGAIVLISWFGANGGSNGGSGEGSGSTSNSSATGSDAANETTAEGDAQSAGSSDSSEKKSSDGEQSTNKLSPTLTDVLPSAMNGQTAIDELGDNLAAVAKKNGKTAKELEDLLLSDPTAYVSTSGHVFFRDTARPEN